MPDDSPDDADDDEAGSDDIEAPDGFDEGDGYGQAGGDDTDTPDLFDDAELEDHDDREAVWEDLDGEDGTGEDGDLFERLAEENPTQLRTPRVEADAETTVVPKDRFCRRCEYFSAPPDVTCGNPGTTIETVVDMERFRVRNCPVVEERQGRSDVIDAE